MNILPRFIRLKHAPHYLGMDKNSFNTEVRPSLTEIHIGSKGIAFDRLDLDAFADDYKNRNGRLGKKKGENEPWQEENTRTHQEEPHLAHCQNRQRLSNSRKRCNRRHPGGGALSSSPHGGVEAGSVLRREAQADVA